MLPSVNNKHEMRSNIGDLNLLYGAGGTNFQNHAVPYKLKIPVTCLIEECSFSSDPTRYRKQAFHTVLSYLIKASKRVQDHY